MELAEPEAADDQVAAAEELWDAKGLSDTPGLLEGTPEVVLLADPELLADLLAMLEGLLDTEGDPDNVEVLDELPELLWDAAGLSETSVLLEGALETELLGDSLAVEKGV